MSPTPKPATGAPAASAPASAPKSYLVTLANPSKSEELQFIAAVRKDGTVSSYVNYRLKGADGKVTETKRGASSVHPTMAVAQKALDAAVTQALALGWAKRQPGGGRGVSTKPDAFTLAALPKPKK
jgi:hypothetical protein